MDDLNLLDNRPLARAAIWFLVDAAIVLAVLCGVLLHPDLIPEYFDEPALHRVGMIALTMLFSVLAITASALGFLAQCRPGRTAGTIAVVFLLAGLAAIGAAYYAAPVSN
jgi:hypothetical protein